MPAGETPPAPPPRIDESLLADCPELILPASGDYWLADRDAAQAAYEICAARHKTLATSCRVATKIAPPPK